MSDSRNRVLAIVPVLIMSFGLAACSSEPQTNAGETSESSLTSTAAEQAAAESAGVEEGREGAGEDGERGEVSERGEHREGGEAGEHDEGREREGEESGVYIGRGDTWDAIRNGVRLVLAFNATSNTFTGRIENMTDSTICAVRVEVHCGFRPSGRASSE